MCIFSGAVNSVSETNIFVKDRGNGKHACVYKMVVDLHDPVAMVLPVPVLAGGGDNALHFINLSNCPTFFDELDDLFPKEDLPRAASYSTLKSDLSLSTLVVHDVGDYEASYVRSMGEFHRLDERFRLPDSIWDRLPNYSEFGFAVFQLKKTGNGKRGKRKFHPMAFEYPPRDDRTLFFPTTHVHDGGTVPVDARFDHTLYIQNGGRFNVSGKGQPWQQNRDNPPPSFYQETHGLISPSEKLHRFKLDGNFPNADQLISDSGDVRHNGLRNDIAMPPSSPLSTSMAQPPKQGAFCTNCGNSVLSEHKFCGGCGTKL